MIWGKIDTTKKERSKTVVPNKPKKEEPLKTSAQKNVDQKEESFDT